MPIEMDNVIVFGDSLSDIGTKWTQVMGKIGLKVGEMTCSASGRFSDSRNWTDFMFTEATSGQSLVKASAQDTIAASKSFLRYGKDSAFSAPYRNPCYYANYAEGGACGGIPTGMKFKMALGTFKDQVERFKKDWHNASFTHTVSNVLFLVWFGANDLYTAGCKASEMAAVAEKVALKRRQEIADSVAKTGTTPHFMFMTLGAPESAVRYNEVLQVGGKTYEGRQIEDLKRGVEIFNSSLKTYTKSTGDKLCQVHKAITPQEIQKLLQPNRFTGGALKEGSQKNQQKVGWKQEYKQHIAPEVYDNPKLRKLLVGTPETMCSDKAHPTDQCYKYIWEFIKNDIVSADFGFGAINNPIPTVRARR